MFEYSSLKILTMFLTLGLASNLLAQETPLTEVFQNAKMNVVQSASIDANSPVQVGTMGLESVSGEDIDSLLKAVPQDKDILLSTDSLVVADKLTQQTDEKRSGLLRLVPLGPLVDHLKDSSASVVKKVSGFSKHIVKSAKEDRFGLIIVTFNTAFDSYIWIHATQFSPEVRAAQILFTTMMAVVFSIDKDMWTHWARKIQNKILNLYSLTGLDPAHSVLTQISTSYLANLTLGLGIQAVRLAILSYDHVINLPFVLSSTASALVISFAYTFATFSWAEFNADIDGTKYPFAKAVARRFSEVRSLSLGHFAPSGKILQTDQYGFTPWITLGVSGAAGLMAFLNTKTLIEWLEQSPLTSKPREAFNRIQEIFQPKKQESAVVVGLSCSQVFN